MARRMRIRDRMYWPQMGYYGWQQPHLCPWGPPPWWTERPTEEEEKDYLKEQIEMLKEELKAAEKQLKQLEKDN